MLATDKTRNRKPKREKSNRVGLITCPESFRSLLPCAVLLFVWCPIFVHGQDTFGYSMVKVHLDHKVAGVLHERHYIPQIQVHEVMELMGVVIDSQGHVASYVGSHWPQLSLAGTDLQVQVEDSAGVRHPAVVVGVDERIALVVLESRQMRGRGLEFGSQLEGNGLQFVSLGNGEWELIRPAVVKKTKGTAPLEEVQVTGVGKDELLMMEGGFALNAQQQLVGIVTRAHSHRFSGRIRVWDVLPSQVVRDSVNQILRERKNIRAGWLGIVFDSKTSLLAVEKVIPDSPAEKAGLRRSDVILRVDEQPVERHSELAQAIRWKGAGSRLNLSVLRQGQAHELSALLAEWPHREPSLISYRLEVPPVWNDEGKPEEQIRIYRALLPPQLNLGLTVDPLTPQLAQYFRCPKNRGLLIKSVQPDSLAHQAGFRAGDVLTQINDQDVSSHADIEDSLRTTENGMIVIRFVRDGQVRSRKVVLQ